ncbi:hypothetical protein PsYK624_025370 [Phanerochaete sordida]|uniref:Uncharacterized protein n=1 Tax=Phanerochaete sordida TaxID=48140 RepID=A0A9P3LA65_9APHY|nr:hypothetical protein PsYK624_025370 [Phanerochaete sordida]
MARAIYGYKRSYPWMLQRAAELGIKPEIDPEDPIMSMADNAAALCWTLALRAGLARHEVYSIFVKEPDTFVWAIASSDPMEDKLPTMPCDLNTQKLKEVVGTGEEPKWWRASW